MDAEKEAFAKILNSQQGIIRKVAYSYCSNIDDRNDLMQEISLQLWRSRNQYNTKYKRSSWTYKIALNVAISYYRKQKRHQEIHKTLHYSIELLEHAEDNEMSEQMKTLHHFIAKLDKLNKALMLLYLDKYQYEEIASTLGISKTNVASKISRIKEQLRKEFQKK